MNGWILYLMVVGLLLGGPTLAGAAAYSIPLDDPELAAQAETLNYAMEHNQINQESTWVNPDTGHSGTIMPVRSFYDSQGLSCREYFQTLRFDGTPERLLGIACRQPDGVWEVMHEQFLSDAYLELQDAPYPYVDRDPYDQDYPWVYYDPFDYPYPIYFSFVFVSHRHHFEPRHFHSGHRFHTQQFRDGRHLAPRQRLPRDPRPKAPLVREQPPAPRFDRGAAPPRQRVDSDRTRAQRQTQTEAGAPQPGRVIEQPLRRPQPAVKQQPLPPAEASRNSGPQERAERRDRNGDDDTRPADRDEKLRRDERSDDDNRGRRGKESKRSDRRERDREDQEERPSRSGDQSRGQR